MGADEKGEKTSPGFKVSDRRSFADSAAAPEPVAPAEAAVPPATPSAPEVTPGDFEPLRNAGGALPPLDFHTFILSLASSALMHLGEIDDPENAASEPDLPLAKHTIDVIAMLQEKTKGNLSPPEEKLIESLLFDLRLRYVEASKKP